MATKTVSIRLSEGTVDYIDRLAAAFSRKRADWSGDLGPVGTVTRSALLHVAVNGWLSDHDEALVKMLEEFEGE